MASVASLGSRLRPGRRSRSLALIALGLGLGSGCGDPDTPARVTTYEVDGKVELASGQPLEGGRIVLVPVRDSVMISSGPIGPDGRFRVSTGESGPGAPQGEYKVRVEPTDPSYLHVKPGRKGLRLPFPSRYLDEDVSGLRVVVRPEPNHWQPLRLK